MRILFFTIFLFYQFAFAQTNSKEIFINFDKKVGIENSILNSGYLFQKKHKTKKGAHQFLGENIFHEKNKILYKGQNFYNIPLKYDLFNENLIVNITTKTEKHSVILTKKYIKSFSIGDKNFINSKKHGYLEVISNSRSIILYKKHTKKRLEKKDKKNRYSVYLKKEKYYLEIKENFYPIKNRKSWSALFPNQKKEIKKHYRIYKTEFKNNKNSFMMVLLKMVLKAQGL